MTGIFCRDRGCPDPDTPVPTLEVQFSSSHPPFVKDAGHAFKKASNSIEPFFCLGLPGWYEICCNPHLQGRFVEIFLRVNVLRFFSSKSQTDRVTVSDTSAKAPVPTVPPVQAERKEQEPTKPLHVRVWK